MKLGGFPIIKEALISNGLWRDSVQMHSEAFRGVVLYFCISEAHGDGLR